MARLPGPARPLAALHVNIAILGREWFVWHECSVALLNPLCSRFPEWVREFIIDVYRQVRQGPGRLINDAVAQRGVYLSCM